MQTRRIVLIGAALGAVSVVTMGAASIVSPIGSGAPVIAPASPAPNEQDDSADPITPGQTAVERAYGWGPFRVVDW